MADNWIPTPQDARLQIATAQVITASGPTTLNYDMGDGFNPVGPGLPNALVVQATAVKTSAGNETYVMSLEESSDGVTWVPVTKTRTITAAGTNSLLGFVNRRYVRGNFTLGGTAPSITVNAWINPNLA